MAHLRVLPLLVGAGLLVAAEPMTLRSVRVDGRTVESLGAGAHHGWALAVLGVAAAALGALAAARDSRPAALGAVLVAGAALWIVLGVDRPALHDTGLVGGRLARAQAGPAWRFELAGPILLLVGAVGVAAASGRSRRH